MNDRRRDDATKIERYLTADLDATERLALEEEILASEELSTELYAAMNVDDTVAGAPLRAPRAVRSSRAAGPRRVASWKAWALPVAAVIALVMFGPRLIRNPTAPPVFRGEESIVLVEPFGALDTPPETFRWSAVQGAATYRFELYDLDEAQVHLIVTADTSLVLTPELRTRVAEGGMWKVVPMGPGGVEMPGSDPAWFTILEP